MDVGEMALYGELDQFLRNVQVCWEWEVVVVRFFLIFFYFYFFRINLLL